MRDYIFYRGKKYKAVDIDNSIEVSDLKSLLTQFNGLDKELDQRIQRCKNRIKEVKRDLEEAISRPSSRDLENEFYSAKSDLIQIKSILSKLK